MIFSSALRETLLQDNEKNSWPVEIIADPGGLIYWLHFRESCRVARKTDRLLFFNLPTLECVCFSVEEKWKERENLWA